MPRRLWPFSGAQPQQVHDLVPSEALADLLLDADEQEIRLQHDDKAARFDIVLNEIAAEVEAAPRPLDLSSGIEAVIIEPIPAPNRRPERFERPSRPAPTLATNDGDLVFVCGLRDDALTVARAMAVATPSIEVAVAGTIAQRGSRHVGDRREALQARADGVRRRGSTIVAIGLGESPLDAARCAGILHDVVPDQVWVAVDVTRKPEDTRVWVHLVADAGGGIDAVAAIGVAHTTTPDSSSYLGVPLGWADGH